MNGCWGRGARGKSASFISRRFRQERGRTLVTDDEAPTSDREAKEGPEEDSEGPQGTCDLKCPHGGDGAGLEPGLVGTWAFSSRGTLAVRTADTSAQSLPQGPLTGEPRAARRQSWRCRRVSPPLPPPPLLLGKAQGVPLVSLTRVSWGLHPQGRFARPAIGEATCPAPCW